MWLGTLSWRLFCSCRDEGKSRAKLQNRGILDQHNRSGNIASGDPELGTWWQANHPTKGWAAATCRIRINTKRKRAEKPPGLLAVFADGYSVGAAFTTANGGHVNTARSCLSPDNITRRLRRDTNQPPVYAEPCPLFFCSHEQGSRVIGSSSFTTFPAAYAGACAEGGDSRVSRFGLGEMRV